MNKVFALVILILLSGIAIAGFQAFGNSVTLNFAFHIGDNNSDDVILSDNNYILAEDNNTVLALLSSGTVFGTSNSSYNATDNLIEIRQGFDNRFLLTFTKGNNQTIINKLNLIGDKKIPSKTFGDFSYSIPTSFPLYIRLGYDDIDIISKTHWSAGVREIIIKNEGKNSRGLPMVSIEVRG